LAWHGMAWHGIAPTTWNPLGFQTNVRINFELWIMSFSRSGTSSPSGSQIISWLDLSTSRTMTRHSPRVNMYPHPILDAEWTTGGCEVESTSRLDSTRLVFWLSESLRGIQWRCLISHCEMQKIDKSTMYSLCSAFWNASTAGYLPCRTY
jgi:hypothetical protein